WATPSPQFRSEGPYHKKRKLINRKKIQKQHKAASKADIDNEEVDKNVNMIDSDIHTFDGEAQTAISATTSSVQPRKPIVNRKKILRAKLREQPALIDNDDISSVKGYSPYPGITHKPLRGSTRGLQKQKALSFGITGKRHRAIHDGQKGQSLISSHKKLFRNYRKKKLRRPYVVKTTHHQAAHMDINDDTVRALDWMMNSLGASDLLEPARIQSKYTHTRVNTNARAEIAKSSLARGGRRGHVIDSVAIGEPLERQKTRPPPVHRPAKILPTLKKPVNRVSKIHDSDLLFSTEEEGDSRPKYVRKPAPAAKKPHHPTTTPLSAYPPDLRASPPVQRAITPILETQPSN
ncbi:hypothetical protein PFISCL1PPCAC_18066, partial [Pristionchus fissidentatus]